VDGDLTSRIERSPEDVFPARDVTAQHEERCSSAMGLKLVDDRFGPFGRPIVKGQRDVAPRFVDHI